MGGTIPSIIGHIAARVEPMSLAVADVIAARERLVGVIRSTPLLYSHTFSAIAGRDVHLKAECLQRTGSFKLRGAFNRIATLPQPTRAVVCASAGNHAQGVALAARLAGLPAAVVMPEGAPLNKLERTRGYGAEVMLKGHSLEEAYATAYQLARERDIAFVHPFDDEAVVAGQGTLGLEVLQQLPEVATVLVPAGGGGLLSGVALAIKSQRPGVRVIGVQAEGADSALQSFRTGAVTDASRLTTLADGIRVGRVSELTMAMMRTWVDDIVCVSDEEIASAIVQLLDRSKLVVEPAGAAGAAALLSGRIELAEGPVCVVLSGGNIDLNLVARVIERGLTRSERYTVLRVRISDRPGSLVTVLGTLALQKVNVLEVTHRRAGYEVPVGQVDVELLVETRDRAHAESLLVALDAAGLRGQLRPVG